MSPQAQLGGSSFCQYPLVWLIFVFADILMSGTKTRPTFIKTDFQHIGGDHAGIAADPDVEKHREVRKMLAPAFNPRALKEQEPALHGHIDRFIDQLEKLGTVDAGVDMREVSLPLIGNGHLAEQYAVV